MANGAQAWLGTPLAIKLFNSCYVKIEVSPPQPLTDNRPQQNNKEPARPARHTPERISILPRKIISMAWPRGVLQMLAKGDGGIGGYA
ncbi:hypothetical protein EMIT051CA3_30972 [Pseudomonas chlororaphis]